MLNSRSSCFLIFRVPIRLDSYASVPHIIARSMNASHSRTFPVFSMEGVTALINAKARANRDRLDRNAASSLCSTPRVTFLFLVCSCSLALIEVSTIATGRCCLNGNGDSTGQVVISRALCLLRLRISIGSWFDNLCPQKIRTLKILQ